jgi:NAD(P) transhydrogenase
VRAQHERYLGEQLARNGVARLRGRARFISAEAVEVREPDGAVRRLRPGKVLIATGSRPRRPAHVPVDHEHVLDSDSILALIYLPTSLTVLGSGVIACEFASIFAALGVEVTLVDAAARPLGFLEPELSAQFVAAFERMGGRLLAGFETRAVRRGPVPAADLVAGAPRDRGRRPARRAGSRAGQRVVFAPAVGDQQGADAH